jgi:hypothetical protein
MYLQAWFPHARWSKGGGEGVRPLFLSAKSKQVSPDEVNTVDTTNYFQSYK